MPYKKIQLILMPHYKNFLMGIRRIPDLLYKDTPASTKFFCGFGFSNLPWLLRNLKKCPK